jgi:transposase
MIALQSDVRVYLACGYTDMRKGMQGLAMLVQQVLAEDPFNGALYAFRGRRGNLLKLVWHDGIGLCMLTKRLERGHFISYGLCQCMWTCGNHRFLGSVADLMRQSAGVRTPGSRDGRSGSYAGIGHPMMTVRRRAASLWPRTLASACPI